MKGSMKTLDRRWNLRLQSLSPLAASLAVGLLTSNARSDVKAYPGTLCKPAIGGADMLFAENGTMRVDNELVGSTLISCPAIRDSLTNSIPTVAVEFYDAPGGNSVWCRFEWVHGNITSAVDLPLGQTYYRGVFNLKSRDEDDVGYYQFTFNPSSDAISGTASLASSQSGAMGLYCSIDDGDRLLHYHVSEQ